MTITLVAGGALAAGAINGGDAVITLPSMLEGDVVFLLGARTGTGAVPTPTGYTSIGSSGNHRVFRKVMGTTPDTTATITGTGTATDCTGAAVYCLRGVNTLTPEDATVTVATATSTNPDPASITTVTANAWVLAFAASAVNDAAITIPTGYGNGVTDARNDTAPLTVAGGTKLVAAAGAENPASWTVWSSGVWAAFTVAVRPVTFVTGTLAATESGSDVLAAAGTLGPPPVELSPVFTVSSLYNVGYTGNVGTGMRDSDTLSNSSVLATTPTSNPEWIKADFGAAIDLSSCSLTCIDSAHPDSWGPTYLNGRTLAYSLDNVGWTTKTASITGSADGVAVVTNLSGINARYLRVSAASDYVALGEFRIWGFTGPTGALAATESGADTAVLTGTVKVQGALAATESGSDTAAVAGTVKVQGSLAATEAATADTAALAGTVKVQGPLAATETGADVFAASGTVSTSGPTGTLAATEAATADTFAATGTVQVQGSVAAAESGADTAAIVGTVAVQGAMAAVESADTAAIVGTVKVQGALAATEAATADTAAITGTVKVQGALAAAESGTDTAAIAGVVKVQGTLTATESGADIFIAAGTVKVQGTMAATETTVDVFAAIGNVEVYRPSSMMTFFM